MKRGFVGWSGGKDCTLALHKLVQEGICQPEFLLTTLAAANGRVSMHGVRKELITRQEFSLGIKGRKVYLPADSSNETYNRYMRHECLLMKQRGMEHAVFGDIFLEDLKKYREERLAEADLQGIFPLWKRRSEDVFNEFVDLGYKAMIICVDERKLGKEFLGRVLSRELLQELPKGVDCCGENGEFHTFAFEGPLFRQRIACKPGEIVYKTYASPQKDASSGFYFLDLLPV